MLALIEDVTNVDDCERTSATPPATIMPKAETPFMAAAPVNAGVVGETGVAMAVPLLPVLVGTGPAEMAGAE